MKNLQFKLSYLIYYYFGCNKIKYKYIETKEVIKLLPFGHIIIMMRSECKLELSLMKKFS